ncbi:XRE family transcriptional regulator [Salmonella enterica]|nr:XRE family transcriptional regulator [Salmonella enterica]EAO9637027.1 XRE family transcriptional regulator [Salmonella enterica]EAU0294262.1 XRE family transcriptional regulator [Salmonella enterica]EBQ3516699.1 helix-turn-helix transcriptional regulator [Salmonella enterica]EBQ3580739.1 helix-turn-helix transcriptional regulator [Salmonella enterica]
MSSSHAQKLREIRKAEKLTQLEFSKTIGIALSTVKNYERGDKEVGLSIIDKVTNHPRFEKYTLWLMSKEGKTNEAAGQISPDLSPDGQDSTSSRRNEKQAG